MASTVRMIMMAKRDSIVNATFALYSKAQANETSTANDMLITDLIFAQSKSVRTSTILLAVFNVLAALGTALSILYDCYWASKRCNPKFKASKFCVSSIHPAETLPLVLAIGIVIQGLVFAAVQGQGMDMLFTSGGCDIIAQYMFPALFIVPFIQVVFGVECALRSLRQLPFQARGKYDVTICGATILLMLIGSWVPTILKKQTPQCFGSLLWFITAFGKVGFVMLCVLLGLMMMSAIVIYWRLSTVNLVDEHQRIAASRVVYYLVLGIMSLAFIVPYFGFLVQTGKGDLKTAMMATVVLNISGLLNGVLHLFLRSNTSTSSFGPKNGRHLARNKHEIRLWGPNELAFTNYLEDPVSGPRSAKPSTDLVRPESQTYLVEKEKDTSSMFSPPVTAIPQKTVAKESRLSRYHSRAKSYSLFPGESTKSPIRPNDTMVSIYDISDLEGPPRIQFGDDKYNRESSLSTTATVQIGLRLSHAPNSGELSPLPLPSTTYNPKNFSTISKRSLLLPIAFGFPRPKEVALAIPSPVESEATFLSSATFTAPAPKSKTAPALQIVTSTKADSRSPTPELPLRSPQRPKPTPLITTALSPLPIFSPIDPSPSVNKDLPPTPRAQLTPLVEAIRASNTKLSPAVYSRDSEKNEKKEWNGLPRSPRCNKEQRSPSTPTPSPLRQSNEKKLPSPKTSGPEKKDWI